MGYYADLRQQEFDRAQRSYENQEQPESCDGDCANCSIDDCEERDEEYVQWLYAKYGHDH